MTQRLCVVRQSASGHSRPPHFFLAMSAPNHTFSTSFFSVSRLKNPNHLPHAILSLLSFLYPVPEICPYIILSCLRQNTAATIGIKRCMMHWPCIQEITSTSIQWIVEEPHGGVMWPSLPVQNGKGFQAVIISSNISSIEGTICGEAAGTTALCIGKRNQANASPPPLAKMLLMDKQIHLTNNKLRWLPTRWTICTYLGWHVK